jgi:hypothetical protein
VPSWSAVAAEAPELAARASGLLTAWTHLTLATLRRDGSPRISGTEAMLVGDDLWIGSMVGAVKARDLRRDPRYALHSGSEDPPDWPGDAKVAGRAEEVDDPERKREVALASSGGEEAAGEPMHLFRLDVEELVVVELGGDPPDRLVITSWHPGRGVERIERR